MIDYVPYSETWFKAQSDFAARMWSKKVRFNIDYVRWKFTRHDGIEGYSLFLAVEDEKVIAQLGAITCLVQSEGQKYRAAWWCDLMMDPAYRGKGIAEGLYAKLTEALDSVLLGSDPSPAAEKSMKRYGFRDVHTTDKFLLPVNIPGFLRLKFPRIPQKLRFSNKFFQWAHRGENPGYRQVTLDFLTDEFLSSIAPFRSGDAFQVQTVETLHWRFVQRPLYRFNYWIYVNEENRECFILYHSGRELSFCPVNNSRLNMREALKIAFDLCLNQGLDYIHLRIPEEQIEPSTRRFLVKSKHSTMILGMDQEKAGIQRFSYSLLDSDQSI